MLVKSQSQNLLSLFVLEAKQISAGHNLGKEIKGSRVYSDKRDRRLVHYPLD